MKHLALGIVIGFALAALSFMLVLRHESDTKYQFGLVQGTTHGMLEAASILRSEFGPYQGEDEYTVLFSVKDSDVIAIEIKGVRTVRVR